MGMATTSWPRSSLEFPHANCKERHIVSIHYSGTQRQQHYSRLSEAAVLYATIFKEPNLKQIDAVAGIHPCISYQVRSAWAACVLLTCRLPAMVPQAFHKRRASACMDPFSTKRHCPWTPSSRAAGTAAGAAAQITPSANANSRIARGLHCR